MNTAIGMIEVKGFLGAVSVLDAALKAANVELHSSNKIRGGLTTIIVEGDVGAVMAATQVGVEVAKDLGSYLSHHVIPRLDEQTQVILAPQETAKPVAEKLLETEEVPEKEEVPEAIEEVAPVKPAKKAKKAEFVVREEKVDSLVELREELAQMRVIDLRKRAYTMNLKALSKNDIKFANKLTLIDAIVAESK